METAYLNRPSLLHSLNPSTKLLGVLVLVVLAFSLPWYGAPTLLFVLLLVPLALLGRVAKEWGRSLLRLFGIVGVALVLLQTFFYPYGDTILFDVWFLEPTLEGLERGYLLASRLLVFVGAFTLLMQTTHPGLMMSDLVQRGLPASLAYILTSTFQIVPQLEARAGKIMDAQRARGLETEGKLRRRIAGLLPLIAPLVFGSLVDVEERTIAIEARAFTAGGPKTSIIEIPDRPWERPLRWLLLLLCLVAIGGRLWLLFS